MLSACRPQAFLAAEVVGDAADIGIRHGGDVPGRRTVESLAAEKPKCGVDKRDARLIRRRQRLRKGKCAFRGLAHDRYLINRMIKVKVRLALPVPLRFIHLQWPTDRDLRGS